MVVQTPANLHADSTRLPAELIDRYIAQVRERQDRAEREALRREPWYGLDAMAELVSLDLAELRSDVESGRWDEAEARIIADGLQYRLDLLRDEIGHRQLLAKRSTIARARLPFDPTLPQRIRDRLDLAEFVGRHGWSRGLRRSGNGYRGFCPFNPAETRPNFGISAGGLWHCFACGEGGDAFTLVQRITGQSFPVAVRILAAEVGVSFDRPMGKAS